MRQTLGRVMACGATFVLALALASPRASLARAAAPTATPTPSFTETTTVPNDLSPAPHATSPQDPAAERDFDRARAWWRTRTDVPYLHYGALVRYVHSGHLVDTWWDAYYRESDGALALTRLHDAAAENRRLRGVPILLFGFKVLDTNADAEPIRLEDPRFEPVSSFGVLTRSGKPIVAHVLPSPVPGSFAPNAVPTDDLREIARIESTTRVYDIRIAGTDTIAGEPALHLTLVPLRDPKINRLRDVWIDPVTARTVQTRVQGLYDGKPYDGVSWTIHYTLVEGRQYVQQIVADAPLKFGIDTTIPHFEIDFVDYHFPTDVPKFTFDRPF